MNSVKLLKRNNSHTLQWKGNSLKALSIATLASLVIFGFNTAQAEENSISLVGVQNLLTSESEFTNSREGNLEIQDRVNYLSNNNDMTLSHFSDVQADTFTSKNFSLKREMKNIRGGIPSGFAADVNPAEFVSEYYGNQDGAQEKYFKFSKDSNNNYILSEVANQADASFTVKYAPTYYSSGSRINNTLNSTNANNVFFGGSYGNYQYGAIYNTRNLSNVNIVADFTGYTQTSGVSSYWHRNGAVILNENGNIGNITANFISNKSTYSSGAVGIVNWLGRIENISSNFILNSNISNNATWSGGIFNRSNGLGINSITNCNFISNSSSASEFAVGGAISNSLGTINIVSGNFINNNVRGSSSIARGGAIGIGNNSDEAGIINSLEGMFVGNYAISASSNAEGGAISIRNTVSSIGKISGLFNGNYVYGRYANGGAIWNNGGTINSINNSSFINNHAQTNSTSYTPYGGAIWLSKNQTFNSTDGYNSTFSGNYVQKGPSGTKLAEAIYVNSSSATLTFNATTNGQYTFDDYFNGVSGYNVTFTGDSTGKVNLYNDVKNGDVSTNTVTMNLANGELHDYSMYTLNSNSNTKWKVDINLNTMKADTITTSASGSTGTVTLDGFNYVAGDLSGLSPNTYKIQVLKTQNSNLKLALKDSLKTENLLTSVATGNTRNSQDAVEAQTTWSKVFKTYTEDESVNVYGQFAEGTTTTTNDSITLTIREETEYGAKTETGTLGDTLKLVVSDDTNTTKEFNAAAEGDSYSVGDNLGTLAGTLTINGVAGGNLETVDLNGNNGIAISGANTLNLNNVKLTDTSTGKTAANTTIATVTNNGANVNLNNAELNGNIVSTSGYNLGLSGNTTLGGSIGKATVTTNTATVKLANNTFTNADVTTDANSTFDLTTDGLKTYEFNTLTSNSDTKWDIDFNISSTGVGSSDIIKTIAASTGTVKLDNLNITGDIDDLPEDMKGNVFIVKILDTQDNNLQLDLSDYVKSQLGTENYEIGRTTLNKDDVVVADNTWTTQYNHKTQDEVTYGRLGLATTTTTNDSIGVTFHHKDTEAVVDHGKRGDTLALVNQSDIGDRNFTTTDENATYVVGENIGATGAGEFTVQGATDGENTSKIDFNGKSGFELSNAGTTLNIKDVEITGANVLLSATAGDSVVNLDGVILDGTNGGITSNGTVNVKGSSSVDDSIAITDGTFNVSDNSVLGGNITLGGTTTAAIKDNSKVSGDITLSDTSSATLSDNSSVSGDITLNDTTKLTVTGDKVDVTGTITGDSTAELNVKDGTFEVKNTVSGVNTVLDNGQLKLTDESLFTAGLTVNTPSSISMQNDKIGALNFNSLTLNDVLTMQIDADLALKTIDTINAGTVTINAGSINVDKINILHPSTEQELSLLFTNNADLANIVSYTGDNEIVYSPIFKYTTTYEKKADGGYFKFVLPSKSGGGASGNSSPAASDFNPAVLSTPVAAQGIAQVGMNHVFSQSFEHADGFMPLPETARMSAMRGNVYAINDVSTTEQILKNTGVSTDFNDNLDFNSGADTTYENKAIWVKPYTSFERINLHNGPKVDMISYGTLVGGDSDFRKLKNGWSNVGTLYLGYNGASMDYSGVDTTFNGGVLGITESFYKKNFFTAISANVGAGFAEAQTMYGHDDMTMLMAGVASKTGYNFEFKEGKFIIQPSLLLSYSMINTFDYRNSAGVKIDSDPLHTIQLSPNVKFIANLKHGWQPYASVGMVYNLMNETKVTANNVKLPETSTRPYVEYGIGVQKHFGETFSGYGQAMVRNGGRNGIALTAGFRWALGGKKAKKDNKNVNNNNVLKDASAMPQHDVSSRVSRSDAPQEVVNTNGAYKDDTLQSKAVVKSVKENSKARNLARYNELIGE